jgi:hypothetical protein
MFLLSLGLKQFAVISLGFFMVGVSLVLCLALFYFLIKLIESKYPEVIDVDHSESREKVTPQVGKRSTKKRVIEPSVPDDIPSFEVNPKIETNFGPGGL